MASNSGRTKYLVTLATFFIFVEHDVTFFERMLVSTSTHLFKLFIAPAALAT